MSDHPLRMARIVARMSADMMDWKDVRVIEAEQLVRDLEAAHASTAEETDLAHWPDPLAPERRTITREEFEKALEWLAWNNDPERDARAIAAAWRLTVEDA